MYLDSIALTLNQNRAPQGLRDSEARRFNAGITTVRRNALKGPEIGCGRQAEKEHFTKGIQDSS